jgi:hypothetical protein
VALRIASGKQVNCAQRRRRRPAPVVTGSAAEPVKDSDPVGGQAAAARGVGENHDGRVEVRELATRDCREQVAAARSSAKIMKAVAEPLPLGDFRGLAEMRRGSAAIKRTNIEHFVAIRKSYDENSSKRVGRLGETITSSIV